MECCENNILILHDKLYSGEQAADIDLWLDRTRNHDVERSRRKVPEEGALGTTRKTKISRNSKIVFTCPSPILLQINCFALIINKIGSDVLKICDNSPIFQLPFDYDKEN